MVTVRPNPQEGGSRGLNRTVVRSLLSRAGHLPACVRALSGSMTGGFGHVLLNEPQFTHLWSTHGHGLDKNAEDSARGHEQSTQHSARQHKVPDCRPGPVGSNGRDAHVMLYSET